MKTERLFSGAGAVCYCNKDIATISADNKYLVLIADHLVRNAFQVLKSDLPS